MGVYQRGKIWWYEFVFEGKRIRESSGSTRQDIAERLEWKRFEALNERRHDIVKPAKLKALGAKADR